uniref:Clip domain-containing protein n=1 Tax=Echinostoma caproni TaxID=27848 RepID=A0A183B2B5_9TREM
LTDVEENILLDPVITHVCHSVLTTKCAVDRADHGRAFDCLFDHQDDPIMSVSCRVHIRELYYFVTRDITLDENLYQACAVDAGKLCTLPKNPWTSRSKPDPFVLTCLYNHRSEHEMPTKNLTDRLSPACETEVLRVVHGRAKRVAFEPRVFEVCLADLAAFCDAEEEDNVEYLGEDEDENVDDANDKNPKKEKPRTRGASGMDCLQRNFNALQPECRAAVVTVSAEVEDDPNLDKLVSQACLVAEQRFCTGFSNPSKILDCLIRHKNHPEMSEPCRAAIEHIQRVDPPPNPTAIKEIRPVEMHGSLGRIYTSRMVNELLVNDWQLCSSQVMVQSIEVHSKNRKSIDVGDLLYQTPMIMELARYSE